MDPPPTVAPPAKLPMPGGIRAAINAARATGDHRRALDLLAQAALAHPLVAWPQLETAAVYREMGEKDGAFATVRALLARDPRNPKAWLQLGLLERSNGQSAAALAAFEQAHALDPANLEAVLNMAQDNFTLGRQQRSDELLGLALRLDEDGIQALGLCAQRAMAADDAAAALPLFERAITRCPWHVPSYIGACNALIKLGRTGPAMALLDTAMDQCGARPALHTRRAQLLKDMGCYREAVAAAEHGLAEHPDSFGLWETVMRLHILVGEEPDMRAWLTRAPAARDAERAAVAGLTGDMECELGNPALAIEAYRTAAALMPTAARLHGAMAVASLTRFDVPGAVAHLRRQTEMLSPALRLKSRSDNPAQSYYGQIINEYRLDEAGQAALAALPEPGAAQIEALRTLCRATPGSTLLASALLDTLGRAGALAGGPEGGDSPIPRRVIQFWDADPPPADVAGLMQSWPEQNPGFTHELFDDRRARAFLRQHYPPDVLRAYHRGASPAMQADLFRLAYLARHGGVYADADDRCTAPLDALLPGGARLVLYREYLGTLANNFLAAAPGHPVIGRALDQAVAAINRGDQEIVWLSTGPGLITRAFAQAVAADAALLGSVRIWPRRMLLRCVSVHCIAGYKDTAQHWVRAAFTVKGG